MSTNAIVVSELPVSRPFPLRLHEWVTTVDHKRLGMLYILFALVFLLVGGVEATIMRLQLVRPHNDLVSPEVFNRMFTMHGTTMIFFVAMPLVFGFANYLVPLMIGARDMAFPKVNMMSYWIMWPAFALILLSFFVPESGPAASGWTSYPPISVWAVSQAGSGLGQTFWLLALICVGVASMSRRASFNQFIALAYKNPFQRSHIVLSPMAVEGRSRARADRHSQVIPSVGRGPVSCTWKYPKCP